MPRVKAETFECSVCMTEGHTKQIFNCDSCKELICHRCVGKLVEVCECGCPAAKYQCPTCRQEVAFVIKQVSNATLLHKIIEKFRTELSCDFGDTTEDDE